MTSLVLYGLLAVLVAGVLFVIAAYLLPAGEQIAPPIRDEPLWDLPAERRMSTDDVSSVRLPVALRGYRFAETDMLLDRLGEELRARDEEIARLRGDAPRPQPSPSAEDAAPDVTPDRAPDEDAEIETTEAPADSSVPGEPESEREPSGDVDEITTRTDAGTDAEPEKRKDEPAEQ